MPLGHRTLSHGIIAFGFFNIQSDCLLLNNHFFFASDFCAWVTAWAQEGPPADGEVTVYTIKDHHDVGNLRWAMQGFAHPGFLSALYERHPFPSDPDKFKQQPEGWQTRDEVEAILKQYALLERIPVRFDKEKELVHLGEYIFDRPGIRELLDYVWRGGMPLWRDDTRPQYVIDMIEAVRTSTFWPFQSMCRNY